ncbi:MAG: c-type cytochrome [Gemmatimonadaceae bacterium]
MQLLLRFIVGSAVLALAGGAAGTGTARPGPSSSLPQSPAKSEGARLFIAYNCADCHGPDGVGLMAPSLQDGRWRFGGSEDSVYRSIADGRPEGMPRWGGQIPADHIRKLTAYVRTLADGKDVTTMSFAQKQGAVDRPGH